MNKLEIINIIKLQNKYSSNFNFYDDYILYTINNNEFKIEIFDSFKKFIFFSKCPNDIKPIQIFFKKENLNEKRILLKFREIIKSINKLYFFINKREELKCRIKPVLISYIKYNFFPDFIFDKHVKDFDMDFQKSVIIKRRKYISIFFDPTKEKIENNIIFEPHIRFDTDYGSVISLNFKFNTNQNKLILNIKEETYKNIGKDISKIIRGEKLKSIISKNE